MSNSPNTKMNNRGVSSEMATLTSIQDCTVLSNGVKMPWLGLGVFKMEDGSSVAEVVKTAVRLGYRSIDTAAVYKNEVGTGQGIKECGVSREELFITTKVWNADQGYDSTLRAFEESRSRLGLDYLDLYLVHWPVKGKYKETWKALADIGAKYGKTPSQVILRWDLQNGVVTIPKSIREERLKENAAVFNFELTAEDMSAIDALNMDQRVGPDPDNFNF